MDDFDLREMLRIRRANKSIVDLSISNQEELYLKNEDLENFWYSRMKKKDPIARIGYSLWSKSYSDVEKALKEAGKEYSNSQNAYQTDSFITNTPSDATYWKSIMANSTIANLYYGILKSEFKGSHDEIMMRIREIGLAIALAHAEYVKKDINKNYGKVSGLLSLEQLADYHHKVFKQFGLSEDVYGGTISSMLPDSIEFLLYGHLYCRDCDSNAGYTYKGVR